jgi:hypothetical protein
MSDYYALYGVFASSREPKDQSRPLLMVDAEKPVEPVVFIRGNPANRGPRVPRRFLTCVSEPDCRPFQQGSGRGEMARAIASAENPLTARVWVNRVWARLFGQGLVTTPSDFGTRSDAPSHPRLLDYLASRFVREGWSTKSLIRSIVLSSVYQQASDERPACREKDPENRMLWRMNRRRLDLESLRDSILVASGQLDKTMGGPSVKLTQRPFPTRRTVYGFIERQNLPSLFPTFDFASPDTHSPARPHTIVPQQALYLMNSPFAMEQASHLAARDEIRLRDTDEAGVVAMYRLALGRSPTDDERSLALRFLAGSVDESVEMGRASPWQYGYGAFDDMAGRLVKYAALAHFTGTAWQGGAELPDAKLGWVTLNAGGGHPGNDADHAAVRRWLAPADGLLTIRGSLEHTSDKGDGVRGRIVSDRQGLWGEWKVHRGSAPTTVNRVKVERGEEIDLVTDCVTGPAYDSFRWAVTIQLDTAAGGRRSWNSATDFRGPPPSALGPWDRFAQVLLMTNEFAYVD